jgi:hypothetical protein
MSFKHFSRGTLIARKERQGIPAAFEIHLGNLGRMDDGIQQSAKRKIPDSR